jgi:protein O-GlcNAc transferase
VSDPAINIDSNLQEAVLAYQQGNLALANTLCQMILATGQRPPLCLSLRAMVAMQVREFKLAADLLRDVQSAAPGDPQVKQQLDLAKKLAREQALQRPDGRKRFLLIKPWGYGFCSDVDHVLGALLLAEMTGRVPVTLWGAGSRFRDDEEDAWTNFFEPVSKHSLADLVGKGLSWFPEKWTEANIREPEINKMQGEWSRMAGIYFLNQRADVAVSDMFSSIAELSAWIRPGAAYSGMPLPRLYRELVKKYLRPRPQITAGVDSFASERFAGAPVIAAHVRGSDKVVEDAQLGEKNKSTVGIVSGFLTSRPGSRLFLMTDDEKIRADYAQRFGDRLVTTDCLRTSTAQGLHYTEQPSRARLGVEVLTDMYLAARCDAFVGVGSSNVAAMIEHLKDWAPGTCDLQGGSIHYTLNPFLHRWELPPEMVQHLEKIAREQSERERAGRA